MLKPCRLRLAHLEKCALFTWLWLMTSRQYRLLNDDSSLFPFDTRVTVKLLRPRKLMKATVLSERSFNSQEALQSSESPQYMAINGSAVRVEVSIVFDNAVGSSITGIQPQY